jgi:hypothetical protein
VVSYGTTRIKATARIACLGWGSLIWNPGDLPIVGGWKDDGPMLPVEFARESGDRRITLVVCEDVQPKQTFWALLDSPDVAAAVAALAQREGITTGIDTGIGCCDLLLEQNRGLGAAAIADWAAGHEFDGVVWTSLPCGFRGARQVMPTGAQVVAHLSALQGAQQQAAREYIEKAPAKINTEYRELIRQELGWS